MMVDDQVYATQPTEEKMPKGYVVFRGCNPGVYYNWDSCNEQVNGFSGASFWSFSSGREVEIACEEKLRQAQERRYRCYASRGNDSPNMSVKHAPTPTIASSSPTIGSPSSGTTAMPRGDRFVEGVILGSDVTMGACRLRVRCSNIDLS
ncbi:hypothetical protein RIF29_13936 [Crotalaria pallida]|uniref:Ribonuclease H1 N-terminal domain-containing protein n=1 Tax=Crotalaria pallida TaxID=3830 RepID=A0AAN9FAV3_CROPI